MSQLSFSDANGEYDFEQVKVSSRLARSQAAQTPNWVFVNLEQGQQGKEKSRESRKVVRSRATAYSHKVAPRGAFKPEVALRVLCASEQSLTRGKGSTSSATSATPFRSRSLGSGRQGRKRQRDGPEPVPKATQKESANISRKRVRSPVIKRNESRESVRSNMSDSSSRSLSPGSFEYRLSDLGNLDASMRDPFHSYPVKYKNWYGKLINFWYGNVFTRSTRVLKASKPELDAYTIWSRKQELQEPALFYCALYLASGIPVAEGLFPVNAALWLRYKTVEAMKQALDDPKRALSNPVILAVGRIALHEHIYGNRELAHNVHRPAQLRMINMRGGLCNMGLPSTTIQLIVWTDALLSAEAGTPAYFADVPRQMAIRSYSPEEAMHVTNHCSPKRNAHPGYGKNTTAHEPPN